MSEAITPCRTAGNTGERRMDMAIETRVSPDGRLIQINTVQSYGKTSIRAENDKGQWGEWILSPYSVADHLGWNFPEMRASFEEYLKEQV